VRDILSRTMLAVRSLAWTLPAEGAVRSAASAAPALLRWRRARSRP
jgi:hypothetical protein